MDELKVFVDEGRTLAQEIKDIVGGKGKGVYVNIVKRPRKNNEPDSEIVVT